MTRVYICLYKTTFASPQVDEFIPLRRLEITCPQVDEFIIKSLSGQIHY